MGRLLAERASARPASSPHILRSPLRVRQLVIAGATLLLGAASFQFGCAPSRLAVPPPHVQFRPEFAGELQVLHVGAEVGGAAGYPIGPAMVVASGHQLAGRIRAAAVEGFPMLAGNFSDRMLLNRNAFATRDDWVVLRGTRARFTPNLIDPTSRPKAGDPVLLGGFFLAGKNYTRKEFWRTPVSIIAGTAVENDASHEDEMGLVLIEVPEGRYEGFSGGPAATLDRHGRLRVWGTVVYQGYDGRIGRRRYVLGVAPLPNDIKDRKRWHSY